MKNLSLITFTYFLLVPLFCLASDTAVTKNSSFESPTNTLLSYDDEFLKSNQAFMVSFVQQNNKLTVSVDIAPGYYLYRHQFKFQSNNLTLSPIELPIGTTHKDEFFGVQQVYKEHLSFSLDIEESSTDASLKMAYQGCAEKGLCYPPTTKKIIINEVKTGDTSVNIK